MENTNLFSLVHLCNAERITGFYCNRTVKTKKKGKRGRFATTVPKGNGRNVTHFSAAGSLTIISDISRISGDFAHAIAGQVVLNLHNLSHFTNESVAS